jgi:hypothetical protein
MRGVAGSSPAVSTTEKRLFNAKQAFLFLSLTALLTALFILLDF